MKRCLGSSLQKAHSFFPRNVFDFVGFRMCSKSSNSVMSNENQNIASSSLYNINQTQTMLDI